MRLLVLGGTEFAGRAVVEAALARGWEVTVFHRGRHAAPDGVRRLLGDRTAVDGSRRSTRTRAPGTSSSTPGRPPRARCGTRRGCCGTAPGGTCTCRPARCTRGRRPPGTARTRPWWRAPPRRGADGLRAGQAGRELAVEEAFGADRSLLVRSGLLLGPYENVGRLPWWLNRTARGGPVLAPARGTCPCSTSTSATRRSGSSTRPSRVSAGRTTSPRRRATPPWASSSRPACG